MGLFNKNTNTEAAKPVKTPETVFNAARANLLMVVAFTALNLVLTLTNADVYFLFSATVPQVILGIGYALESTTALTVCAVIAFLGAGVYLLCWLLSKKHRGWIIAALVLFALDTMAALGMVLLDTGMLIDLLFHVWVMYYLITGTSAYVKLKDMPPVEEMAPVYTAEGSYPVVETPVADPVITDPAPVMVNGEPVEE